jgi:hypothetical protein
MEHSKRNRAIIATVIHGGPGMEDLKHIMSCAVAIFTAAGGDLDLLSHGKVEITVTVEGVNRPRKVNTDFALTAGWCQLKELELGIATIEDAEKPKKGSRNLGPDKPEFMLGIGSREFCMAFAHLWATSSEKQGASQWGFHMIRKLATSEPRMVVWYDTLDGKLTCGDIGDMYKDVRGMIVAAT